MSFAFFGGPRRAVDCRFYFPPATITFLNGTNKRIHSNRTATFSARAGPLDGIVAPLTGSRPCERRVKCEYAQGEQAAPYRYGCSPSSARRKWPHDLPSAYSRGRHGLLRR